MPRFNSPVDGAQLFYRDYKPTTPTQQPALLFIHGWPYSSLMFEQLLIPLCQAHGTRCIAPDRRGFGNSDWDGPGDAAAGIDYQTFADDTAHLVQSLATGPFVVVASSMGPGESVLAYQSSQYFRDNCNGFIWLAPSLPCAAQSADNPHAPPETVWASIRDGFGVSRGDFTHAALPGALVGETNASQLSVKTLERYEYIVGQADPLAIQRCVGSISETGFRGKLHRLAEGSAVPILCIHGTDDAGMPYEVSTKLVREIVPRVEVKLYEGAAHGLQVLHRDRLLEDILGFVRERVVIA
ncbi:alpha/beta hydrolase fold protein [Aspergillus sp. HF37]|nr:alpha/beta hydrolase fold protein [Aspergillus sp. HF37]